MLVRGRLFLSLLCCGAALVSYANAGTVSATVPLAGNFTAGVSGGGSATLDGASGNFRQWLLFTHANIGVSASPQNVGLSVSNVPVTSYSASGSSDLTYDNVAPTEPLNVDSLDVDLLGGASIPVGINVNPFGINTSLGNFNLQLTFSGQITNLVFVSDGPSDTPGALYDVPGKFVATMQGAVTGQLVGVPIIGNVGLGTLYTLPSTEIEIEGSLPGAVLTTDLSGGSGPYPADMLATYLAALENIEAPIELPFNVAISQTVPNGQSGFSSLNASGVINATLNFNTVSYELNGIVTNGVVPEPHSFALAVSAVLGAVLLGMYRRKR